MIDILVVEDGDRERERLFKLFSSAGYSAKAVSSAAEAENLLRNQIIRLVTLDIGLDDKSGSSVFNLIGTLDPRPISIILTGNPSVHLKQRFLEEGAEAFVVKASAEASNSSLLSRVRSLLGDPQKAEVTGLPLKAFLRELVTPQSVALFHDDDDQIMPCHSCGSQEFLVSFSHKTQLPPVIEGMVVCRSCGKVLDPELG